MSSIPSALVQLGLASAVSLAFAFVAFGVVRLLHVAADPTLGVLRPPLQRLDGFLAIRVADWLGLDETSRARRWGRLLLSLLALAAIGALAPAPIGVLSLSLGLACVVAVFRRWAWDEDDRAAGLKPMHKRIPGAEDYNNELLAALSAVFMLGSLLIWRLEDLSFFLESPDAGLSENILYVLSETLEALPIVGNVDVLGYDNPAQVQAVQPTGGWVAFALRMALDLLVIGGLLKAVEVAGRIARGQDLRRHDEMIATGNDAVVEKAIGEVGFYGLKGDRAAIDRLIALARPGPDQSEPIRRRLQAARMLAQIVEGGAPDAFELLTVITDACNEIERTAEFDGCGLQGALWLLAGEAWEAQNERTTFGDPLAITDLAILNYRRALAAEDDLFPFSLNETDRADVREAVRLLTRQKLADMLIRRGRKRDRGDHMTYLEEARRVCRELVDEADRQSDSETWASRMISLADSTAAVGEADPSYAGSVLLSDAIDLYGQAVDVLSPDRNAPVLAAAKTNIAVVHDIIAARSEGQAAIESIRSAIESTHEAIDLMPLPDAGAEASDLDRFCVNLNNLASQNFNLALHLDDAPEERLERLTNARGYYVKVTSVLASRNDFSGHWISAMRGAKDVLLQLVQVTDGPDRLEHLTEAFEAARRIVTSQDPEHDPRGWLVATADQASIEGRLAIEMRDPDQLDSAIGRIWVLVDGARKMGETDVADRLEAAITQLNPVRAALRAARDGAADSPP